MYDIAERLKYAIDNKIEVFAETPVFPSRVLPWPITSRMGAKSNPEFQEFLRTNPYKWAYTLYSRPIVYSVLYRFPY